MRLILLFVLVGSAAFAGSPRLTHVYPAGVQRGAEIEINCKGSNLEDAKSLLFDEAGFEVTNLAPDKAAVKAKLKVAPDTRLGEHSFRVITATGVSDLRLLYVTPFPMVEEVEAKPPAPSVPQPVALGTTVYGRTQGEDRDEFEVEAKKGQRISAEVLGARFQTQQIYDPVLTIKAASGQELVEVDDTAFTRQDPVASVIAPEDGKYIVTIREATNAGQGECEYLLNIGSFPRPLAVYPPGGPAGEDLKVQLIGDAAGPLERTIKLPDAADERFEIFPEDGQPAPQPNFVRVSPFLNVLEAEPNDEITKATAAPYEAPFALNGIIGAKGDTDCFKFTAKKDASYDLSVFARRLRSPLDSVINVYDAKGNRLGNNDDSGSPDSYLRWKAPADGDFFLQVSDQLSRGGPTFTYRVEVTPVAPRITVWLPEMVQNSNQERRAIVVPKGNRYASLVRVKRSDIGGALELSPQDLPPGVTVTGTAMDKSTDTVPMVFEAAADAPLAARDFSIQATPVEAPKDVVVKSAVEHDVDVAENGNQKSFYAVKESRLPVAVIDEVPIKLTLVQPKVPLLQTGSMNLKVIAERKNDFKGPIALALLWTPNGLGTAGTVQIKEGENEGVVTISANGNAPTQKWKICVVGSADFGKGPIWVSTELVEIEVGAPLIGGQIARTFVDQGDSTTVTVKLDQKTPFEGKAKLALLGLPPNVTADEQEITKDDKEAKFTVKAGANAPPGQHKQMFCQFTLAKDGESMNTTFGNGGILRIDKATVAKNEEAKK